MLCPPAKPRWFEENTCISKNGIKPETRYDSNSLGQNHYNAIMLIVYKADLARSVFSILTVLLTVWRVYCQYRKTILRTDRKVCIWLLMIKLMVWGGKRQFISIDIVATEDARKRARSSWVAIRTRLYCWMLGFNTFLRDVRRKDYRNRDKIKSALAVN